VALTIHAWNLMGGLDWTALPLVVEMLGIRDIEPFIYQLVAIRDRRENT